MVNPIRGEEDWKLKHFADAIFSCTLQSPGSTWTMAEAQVGYTRIQVELIVQGRDSISGYAPGHADVQRGRTTESTTTHCIPQLPTADLGATTGRDCPVSGEPWRTQLVAPCAFCFEPVCVRQWPGSCPARYPQIPTTWRETCPGNDLIMRLQEVHRRYGSLTGTAPSERYLWSNPSC